MAGSRVLTVGVGPTFATRWLIPRLADFQKEEPEVEVRFATGGATLPFNDDWTCGIRLGDGDWPGLHRGAAVRGRSHAGLLARDGEAAEAAGRSADRDVAARAHAADEWPRWFKAAGLSKIRAKGPEFEYYGQALQAAADGVGVAMGISPYVDDDLKAGRLVAPFAQSVSKGKHWYLIYREARKDEPRSGRFGPGSCAPPPGREALLRLGRGRHRLAARRVLVRHALRHEALAGRACELLIVRAELAGFHLFASTLPRRPARRARTMRPDPAAAIRSSPSS